jgi:ribosomal protein S12 methylthiotransferase accessory factor
MEGIEMSHVEIPQICGQKLSQQMKAHILRLNQRDNRYNINTSHCADMQFYYAVDLYSQSKHFVPECDLFYSSASLYGTSTKGITNGLASGNTYEEAILHSLYELIERDAIYASEQNPEVVRDLNPSSFNDAYIKQVSESLSSEGHLLRFRLLPSKTSAWVIEANIYERGITKRYCLYPGWGSHSEPYVTARRAIAEAVQAWSMANALKDLRNQSESRRGGCALSQEQLTLISSFNNMYQPLDYWLKDSLSSISLDQDDIASFTQSPKEEIGLQIQNLLDELKASNVGPVFSVHLSSNILPVHVVRCFSPGLDCPAWI